MHRFRQAVFKDKEMAKKLTKKEFIIVKAFEEENGNIITVVVKNVLYQLKLLCK